MIQKVTRRLRHCIKVCGRPTETCWSVFKWHIHEKGEERNESEGIGFRRRRRVDYDDGVDSRGNERRRRARRRVENPTGVRDRTRAFESKREKPGPRGNGKLPGQRSWRLQWLPLRPVWPVC